MDSLTSTFAAVADEHYRRERVSHGVHGGAREHHPRFGASWRDRRRAGRSAGR